MVKIPACRTAPVLMLFPLTVTLVGLTGCGGSPEAVVLERPRPVKMVELNSGGIERELEFPGQIRAAKRGDLAFEVPGFMQEVLVEEGEAVKVGDALAQLDPRDFEANKAAAEAQLNAARVEAERARSLFEREATSRQRLDSAEANFRVAQANFIRAEKALEDTTLRAPFDGRVAAIYVEDVVNVQAKQTILTVQDTSTLRVVIDIPETVSARTSNSSSELAEVSRRVQLQVFLSALPERTFPGIIAEVAGLADPATRTFQATISFVPPADLTILPGMTAVVRVAMPRDRTGTARYAVPSHAVMARPDGGKIVWLVDGETQTVSAVAVETVEMAGDQIEIIGPGLDDGQLIATSGIQFLREGQAVRRLVN